MEKYRVAIVGATGLVGQEILKILEQRNFPLSSLSLFASGGTAATTISGSRRAYPVQPLEHLSEHDAFQGVDLVFFAAGEEISRHWIPLAVRTGATAIDSSSFYRMEPDVPLIVPEINPDDIQGHRGIISSPNCSSILLSLVLHPLSKIKSLKKAIVSTYQSTSGVGSAAMIELTLQTEQMLKGESPHPEMFPHEIGFNILPQVDVFLDNGYTKEEFQLLVETRKILHNNDILVAATCVRVPTFKGHCQAVSLEFAGEINLEVAKDTLSKAPGVRVVDDTGINLYPHPRMAAGTDMIMVGRIRQDIFNVNGLVLWVVADNIRKGAALNMVQIAEEILKKGRLKVKGII